MAIAITDRIEERANPADNSTSYTTTASLTPTLGSTFIAIVATHGDTGTAANGTMAGPNALGWTFVRRVTPHSSAVTSLQAFVAAGDGGAAGTVTFTHGGTQTHDNITVCIYEVTGGVTTIGALGAGMLIAANSGSQTIVTSDPVDTNYAQAWAAGSAGFAAWTRWAGNVASTPRSGWTERYDQVSTGSNLYTLAVHSRLDVDTAAGADWTGTDGGNKAGLLFELAAATTGGTPYYLNRRKRRPRG